MIISANRDLYPLTFECVFREIQFGYMRFCAKNVTFLVYLLLKTVILNLDKKNSKRHVVFESVT